MRVLIVEDEPYLAEAIRDGLRLEAIAADIAGDGDTALERLRVNAYDIAILDRDIPGPSGDEIARRIVASGSGMPILMLTAADRLDDKTSGFELGADDYLTKPFEFQELVLRLRALDRRRAHNRPPVRQIAGLRLDPFRREVYRDDRYVALTRKQFAVLEVLVAAEGASSAPKSSSNGPGTSTPTRSPTPCASPSPHCASAWANPPSSPPWPASGTASTRHQTARMREATVERAPGMSVRLKLTLSYAAFVMLAGALLLGVVWVFLLRYVPRGGIVIVHQDTRPRLARPRRAPTRFCSCRSHLGAFLVVFGLLGGWLLAGRMLAPLGRITDATAHCRQRIAVPSHSAPGPQDEFRELADAFDTMLAQLEAQVAEQQSFAANASHELRTPLAITQTLLDVARNDPDRDSDELLDRLYAVNARAIDVTEALLLLSQADRRSFTPECVDLSLIAEEATETLLAFAERRGITIETSGDRTPCLGSHALLLQMTTNLVHNAIVHNLPRPGHRLAHHEH